MFKYIITAQLLSSPVYYLIALTVGGIVAMIGNYRCNNKRKSVVLGLITAYLTLIFSLTIIARTPTEHKYELMLFWSYIEICRGNTIFIYENILNVLMLMPLGVLLPIGFEQITYKQAALSGFLVSLIIEVMQLLTRRGLFEFDDILHNTLGCLLGYAIYKLIKTNLIDKLLDRG